MNIDATIWVALISAIIGTLGTKIVDASIARRLSEKDLTIHSLDSNRQELLSIEQELDQAEDDVDSWKEKYYALKEQNLILKAYIAQLDPDLLLEKNALMDKKDQP